MRLTPGETCRGDVPASCAGMMGCEAGRTVSERGGQLLRKTCVSASSQATEAVGPGG